MENSGEAARSHITAQILKPSPLKAEIFDFKGEGVDFVLGIRQ